MANQVKRKNNIISIISSQNGSWTAVFFFSISVLTLKNAMKLKHHCDLSLCGQFNPLGNLKWEKLQNVPWFQYLQSRFQVWRNRLVCVPHLRDEETETLREHVTCPRSYSWLLANLLFRPEFYITTWRSGCYREGAILMTSHYIYCLCLGKVSLVHVYV